MHICFVYMCVSMGNMANDKQLNGWKLHDGDIYFVYVNGYLFMTLESVVHRTDGCVGIFDDRNWCKCSC